MKLIIRLTDVYMTTDADKVFIYNKYTDKLLGYTVASVVNGKTKENLISIELPIEK